MILDTGLTHLGSDASILNSLHIKLISDTVHFFRSVRSSAGLRMVTILQVFQKFEKVTSF